MTLPPLPHATPEDVGLSTAGLARLGSVMRGEIERGRVPGAVALVARRGRLAAPIRWQRTAFSASIR
jgi:hypothetical protein